jgi:hypothetical protein
LRVEISPNDWNSDHRLIDVLTDREKLVEQFRGLATAIGDHPNLGHHFLCHGALPEGEYERVYETAEREWQEGVQQGRFADDYDAENEFCASKLAGVPLPADCARLTEQYRAMLRTLEIPQEWMVRYGLAAIDERSLANLGTA